MNKNIKFEIKFISISFLIFVALNIFDVAYNFFLETPDGKGGQYVSCWSSKYGLRGCDIQSFLSQYFILKILIGIPISFLLTATFFFIAKYLRKWTKI